MNAKQPPPNPPNSAAPFPQGTTAPAPLAPIDRGLSILDPWAWLIVNGFKSVENRTWHTAYRGRILVQSSSSKRGLNETEEFIMAAHPRIEELLDRRHPRGAKSFHFGCAVGTVAIVGCVNYITPAEERSEAAFEACCRDDSPAAAAWLDRRLAEVAAGTAPHPAYFAAGTECFLLESPEQFAAPFEMKGALNLFKLTPEIAKQTETARRLLGDPLGLALQAEEMRFKAKAAAKGAK